MDSILAGIAQLVEHRIRNAKVSGSIPLSGIQSTTKTITNKSTLLKLFSTFITDWKSICTASSDYFFYCDCIPNN